MNNRGVVVLALAVLCGLGSMIGVNKLLRNQKSSGGPRKDVLVVTSPIAVEEVVTEQKVELKSIPAELVPAGALADFKLARGRWARYPMMEGDVVLDSKLAERGKSTGMMGKLRPGMRAFAIPVNEQSGISGFILPDYRVDIIRTGSTGKSDQTQTLLKNVRVLAAGQVIENPQERTIKSETVTVEVTPAQAERLATAMKTGTLSFTLRPLGPPDDDSMPEEPTPEELPPTEALPTPEARLVVSLPTKLEPGMRAMTIPIDDKTGKSGHISPGNRVDIIQSDPEDKATPARAVLENVEVLATGQTTENSEGRPIEFDSVTVKVTPDQVNLLTTAMNTGRLSVSLRPMPGEGDPVVPVLPAAAEETTPSAREEVPSLTSSLRRGMRAVTIPADKIIGGLEHLAPEDRVDILQALQAQQWREGQVRPILRNVRVLASGQPAGYPRGGPATEGARDEKGAGGPVILEVEPDHVGELTRAMHEGQLILTLLSESEAGDPGGPELDPELVQARIMAARPVPKVTYFAGRSQQGQPVFRPHQVRQSQQSTSPEDEADDPAIPAAADLELRPTPDAP